MIFNKQTIVLSKPKIHFKETITKKKKKFALHITIVIYTVLLQYIILLHFGNSLSYSHTLYSIIKCDRKGEINDSSMNPFSLQFSLLEKLKN